MTRERIKNMLDTAEKFRVELAEFLNGYDPALVETKGFHVVSIAKLNFEDDTTNLAEALEHIKW